MGRLKGIFVDLVLHSSSKKSRSTFCETIKFFEATLKCSRRQSTAEPISALKVFRLSKSWDIAQMRMCWLPNFQFWLRNWTFKPRPLSRNETCSYKYSFDFKFLMKKSSSTFISCLSGFTWRTYKDILS